VLVDARFMQLSLLNFEVAGQKLTKFY